MRFSVSDIKRKHALRAAIEHLQATSDVCFWITLTFAENVEDKGDANECWRTFSRWLTRGYSGVRLVGVWARQRRGAWHMHGVLTIPGVLDLHLRGDKMTGLGGSEHWRAFREAMIRAGFGWQFDFQLVGPSFLDGRKLANYLGNYMTDKNGLDPVRDKSVRRLVYLGDHVRMFGMRWKSSFKRIVSMGRWADLALRGPNRKSMCESWGEWYHRFVDHWFQLGWGMLSASDQEEMLIMDKFTERYLKFGLVAYV
jgi:hypothetical protein